MAVVSFRLFCEKCGAEDVVREIDIEESPWKVNSRYSHSGVCPECNPAVNKDDTDWSSEAEEIDLESLDNIGKTASKNLKEAGIDTVEAVEDHSDEEILSVDWVGEKGLLSLKERAKELEPQKRWKEND